MVDKIHLIYKNRDDFFEESIKNSVTWKPWRSQVIWGETPTISGLETRT